MNANLQAFPGQCLQTSASDEDSTTKVLLRLEHKKVNQEAADSKGGTGEHGMVIGCCGEKPNAMQTTHHFSFDACLLGPEEYHKFRCLLKDA